ncbi:chitinase-like protein Idgf5 [Cochliomyia hominivorax]
MGRIKLISLISIIYLQVINWQNVQAANMVCFLDTSRVKSVQQTIFDIDPAMQFCNYLIYGYAGINSDTYQLKTLDRGLNFDLYHAVTALKRKHAHLKVLLSVGGDRDLESEEEEPNKYLLLLENIAHRNAFINSAQSFVNTYGFDGLDLAWQFPKNPPKEVYTGIRKAWNKFKGLFKGRKVVDEKAEEHREQFVSFVRELRQSMSSLHALLTVTVLPHVSAELFFDIPQIVPQVDFVNLATFDYYTPLRDPKIADYTASIYELFERNPELNIDYQIQYWLNHTVESGKLMMGVPAYGRSWVMTKESGITGYPPIPAGGAAPAGNLTQTIGLLSYPEICVKLHKNRDLTGDEAPVHKVGDPTKRYGTYCYRDADENGEYGLWVSYEEPVTAANKANYARVRSLGGVALFDLLTDDVLGTCGDGKYPILRSIKYKL